MNKTKALLLSGLVFPGLGQLANKRFAIGLPVLIIALLATGYIVFLLFDIASSTYQQILSGDLSADPLALREQIYTDLYAQGILPSLAVWSIAISWLIGVLDILIFWKKQNA